MSWLMKLIGKDGTNIATTSNGVPVFTGDATAVPAGVGSVRMQSENDSGVLTGSPYLKGPETSDDYRLRVGTDTYLFDCCFNETVPDLTKVKIAGIATMTTALQSNFVVLNASAAATASGNYVSWQTNRFFLLRGAGPIYIEIDAQVSALPISGQVIEFGQFGFVAGTQPADGVWLQWTSAGLIGVIGFSGAITQTGVLPTGTLSVNKTYKFTISVSQNEAEFWLDDQLLGHLDIPIGQATPFTANSQPVTFMQRNNAVVSATGQAAFKVASITVSQADLALSKPWSHQACGMGLMGSQGQSGGAAGSTAAYPNATAATTLTGVALSQTAAIATGLGGQANITAGAAGIDGMVTAFLCPSGALTQTPRNLVITGMKIASANVGAAVATTSTTMAWSLAYGATGATIPSLAQAEAVALTAVTAKAWRRVPIGIIAYGVGTGVGFVGNELNVKFDSPIVVHPNEWVASVCKFIVGTATASQVIHCHVMFDAYWD